MAKFDVTQFKNPYEDEPPCQICHHMDCECPECDVCGVAGDPACINTHMEWRKWGHFQFAPTKQEREDDAKRMELEAHEFDDVPNGVDNDLFCSEHQCAKNLVDYPDGSRYECPECQRENGEALGYR